MKREFEIGRFKVIQNGQNIDLFDMDDGGPFIPFWIAAFHTEDSESKYKGLSLDVAWDKACATAKFMDLLEP